MTEFKTICKAAEVNSDFGVVIGFGLVCKEGGADYYDLHGDHVPEAVMLRAVDEYMQGDRVCLDMHSGEPIGKALYGLPMTSDTARALGYPADKTGFIIGMKLDDPTEIAKFKSGERSEFSMGGVFRRSRPGPDATEVLL